MRSERATYLDSGSSADAEAGRRSGAQAPRAAGWALSRSALVALAALASACAAAAAAAAWTTPRAHLQSGARESPGHPSSAVARALAGVAVVGTHNTDDVYVGSQFVSVQNSRIFQAGDQITLLDQSVVPEVSEQGRVVLVEASVDRLVLQKPVSNYFPTFSMVISPKSASPAPTSPNGGADDTWSPSSLPQLPPSPLSSRVVAPQPTAVVIDDGGLRSGAPTSSSTMVAVAGTVVVSADDAHKAANEGIVGAPLWFSVIFASVVCFMLCAGFVSYMGIVQPQAAAFIDRKFGFSTVTTSTEGGPRPDDLVTELFNRLDTDGNQFLDASELFVLAKHNGYPGSRTDWGSTYSRLAEMHFREDEAQGCTLMQFRGLIADRSGGFYVSDEDMEAFLES